MRWRTTLLCLLAAALLTALNAGDAGRRAAAAREAARARRLVPIPLREVLEFALTDADGQRVVCRRDGNAWRIVEPFRDLADQHLRQQVLALVSYGQARLVGPGEAATPAFGPEQPSLAIAGADLSVTLQFGGPTPDGASVYVRPAERPDLLFTLDRGMAAFLAKPPEAFRETDLFPGGMTDVQRIEIEGGPDGRIVLRRGSDGWLLQEPVNWPADGDRTQTLLRACAELRADAVLAQETGSPEDFGLGEDAARVTLIDADGGRSVRLAPPLSAGDPAVAMAAGRSPVFAVPGELLAIVRQTPADRYRKRRLEPLAGVETVHEIRIEHTGGLIRFVREGESWQGLAPERFAAASSRIGGVLLPLLQQLTVQEFVDPAAVGSGALGLDPPAVRVQALGPDGREAMDLSIGAAADGDAFYARLAGRPGVFTVGKLYAQFLSQPWYTHRQRQIAFFDLQDARKLIVWRDGTKYGYQRTVGDAWQMTDPQTVPADALALYKGPLSHKGLGDLRALAWVGTVADGLDKFGLDPAPMRVVVEFALPMAQGSRRILTRDFEVGAPMTFGKTQARYARLRGEDLVFLIDEAVVQLLLKDYSDPGALD